MVRMGLRQGSGEATVDVLLMEADATAASSSSAEVSMVCFQHFHETLLKNISRNIYIEHFPDIFFKRNMKW